MSSSTPSRGATGERRDFWAFGRSDRWGLGLLLALGVTATLSVKVVVPILDWVRGEDLAVPYFSRVDVPGLSAGLGHTQADYQILIPDPTARQRLLDLIPGLGYAVLVAAIAWLVLGLVRTIGRAQPFAAANVRRLRTLALLLMVGWSVLYFAEASCSLAILTDEDLGVDGGPRAILQLPVVPFAVGMVTALLAEAFRVGARLEDDVEGLV